jgi:hypothetical protein
MAVAWAEAVRAVGEEDRKGERPFLMVKVGDWRRVLIGLVEKEEERKKRKERRGR